MWIHWVSYSLLLQVLFLYFNIGAEFVSGTNSVEALKIICCEGRYFLVLSGYFGWKLGRIIFDMRLQGLDLLLEFCIKFSILLYNGFFNGFFEPWIFFGMLINKIVK